MSNIPSHKSLWGRLWRADGAVSTAVFETWDFVRRAHSAYANFLERFRLRGPKRLFIDLLDDGATFGVVFCFLLLAYALPPFSGTGDVWNRGREYAVTFTTADGEIIGRRGIRQDDAIPLTDIPPHMIKAVLATEDARFFEHFGVDVIGTLRAIVQNARANNVVQGGSSLTQQVAKNLFLSPERTIRRKVHEAFLSLWLEARLTKQEILKLYLDRSYLGGGNYGIEAASQFYFGKSVRDVTLPEAAMLAGLFKAPTKYAPHQNLELARARANTVLYRMLDAGFITQGELLEARREPATPIEQKISDSPNWFLDQAYRDTMSVIDAKGLTGDFVLEVKTTVNLPLQTAAQNIVKEEVAANSEQYRVTQGAAVVMAPDGAVRAIVGGVDYEASQFSRATDALRQSGSSFKPFVYMAALLKGYKPSDTIIDGPVSVGNWAPRNYTGKYAGRTTLLDALAHSYNSVPVKLMLDIDRPAIIETAHLAGIRGGIETLASMVLGTSALSLIDLTSGYLSFASGGLAARPYTVLEIRRSNGDVLYERGKDPDAAPRRVFPENKVAELNTMLNAVVKQGTGKRADLAFEPTAGKTGTNQGYRDAWFIGFTGNNVAGVWLGNDDFTPMNEVTGGLLPAPVWKRIMMEAERGLTPAGFAGVPYDGSYALAAAGPPQPVAPEAVSDETDQAQGADTDTQQAAAGTGDVNGVLNGMFDLFETTPPVHPAVVAAAKAAPKRQEALVLPKANVDDSPGPKRKSSFIDQIFGGGAEGPVQAMPEEPRKQKKKKKKKTLFDSIF
ncbi:transglycosylase domain-containing protein [Aestuariivirga sp.]|uniref:transglycosylase domain-containing protein n=1 Tax=Aestuariivirga sp. TaxID=2650926 RepID=UPI0025BC9F78|nr:PBP1A family penicillin-binding protein [Aestuariivirga sp.]MCA3555290.1 PBP1A family penicillin-binding protein [Aestuariivirga sp.]